MTVIFYLSTKISVARVVPDFVGIRRVRLEGPTAAVQLLDGRREAEPDVRGQPAAGRARDARLHHQPATGNQNSGGGYFR